ncbi:MAG: squalene--hopene cyclase, partial [Verrucomicrobia bacterium]|nr:squalene--hopene cyclase [Verrucomicrobiota bacterium]
LIAAGAHWLLAAQNPDGGWAGARGAASSVEETALAIEALAVAAEFLPQFATHTEGALHRGGEWLLARVESGAWRAPSPIGFYFARLWYFEESYPKIFTVAALRALASLAAKR